MSLRAKLAALFLCAVVLAACLAALSPNLLPYGETQVRSEAGLEVLRPPSVRHWLGTDDRGRDVGARLWFGARTSLSVIVGVLALALSVGVLFGMLAGSRGGAWDAGVVAGCDTLGALPPLLLVVAAQGLLRGSSLVSVIALIALPRAAEITRLVRAAIQSALAAPFCEAARALGGSRLHVVWRHAIPHALPQLAVAAALTVPYAVLAEAALTFLGFGTPVPAASWGELLRQAHQSHLAWWLAVPAGLAVALVALAANVLADELAAKAQPLQR
jgi:peptide/nickel transport system permease protein